MSRMNELFDDKEFDQMMLNNYKKIFDFIKQLSGKTVLIIVCLAAIIITLIVFIPSKEERFQKALTNYDLPKAYTLLGKFKGSNKEGNSRHQQLIRVAVPYYLRNNQPQAAVDAVSEYNFQSSITPGKTWVEAARRQAYNNETEFYNTLMFDIAIHLLKSGNVNEAKDIVNFKLVPYADENDKPTFVPIQQRMDNFQNSVNDLAID